MGKVISGRWGSGRSESSPRSKARGTRSAAAPPSQLKISLLEIEPEIWRRVLVPRGVGLDRLHEIFQVAMGWTNSHLHEFRVGDTRYGELDPEYDEGNVREERSVQLFEVAPGMNDSFLYEYDFGDSWEHLVWGVPGYEGFLEAIRDPAHEEHQAMLAWLGGKFDPEAFDLGRVNRLLRPLK